MFSYLEISVSEKDVILLVRHDQINSTDFLALNLGTSGTIPYIPKQVIFSLQKCINVRKGLPSRLHNRIASMDFFSEE